MTPINAIAKVRFSSSKAQRVHLVPGQVEADLLCLEGQQEMPLPAGAGVIYVVAGSATIIAPDGRLTLPAGQLISPENDCTLTNLSEQRLVCLAFKRGQ